MSSSGSKSPETIACASKRLYSIFRLLRPRAVKIPLSNLRKFSGERGSTVAISRLRIADAAAAEICCAVIIPIRVAKPGSRFGVGGLPTAPNTRPRSGSFLESSF